MTLSLAQVRGVRLNPERDLKVLYTVGRFGAVTVSSIAPLYFGSAHTAGHAFTRLTRLGLLRSFPRKLPCLPAWYAMTKTGLAWVMKETGAPESEFSVPTRLDRTNLPMRSSLNALWVSLVLACRREPRVRLALVRPERELRRLKEADVPVVPDMQVELHRTDGSLMRTYFVELDAGHERLRTWQEKARAYTSVLHRPLYGAMRFRILAVVPSVRRARTIAGAVAGTEAGALIYLAVEANLVSGQAFASVLYRATDLAKGGAAPSTSLIKGLVEDGENPGVPQAGVNKGKVPEQQGLA